MRYVYKSPKQPKRETFHIKGQVSVKCLPATIILASDVASGEERNVVSSGYIRTDGYFGISAYPTPAHKIGANLTLVGELRAVYIGLRPHHDDPVLILSDSSAAVDYLKGWRNGDMRYPPGYDLYRKSGHHSSLEKLALRLHKNPDRYTVERVIGHSGHPLNEAADSLAKLGLRTLRGSELAVNKAEADRLARIWVQRTL